MIYIEKQNEPPLLKQYKKEKQDKGTVATYEDFTESRARFDQLRLSLLTEQKYICCYCQQRIPEPLSENTQNHKTEEDNLHLYRMKTEHFHPKGGVFQDLSKVLEYENLLAACRGNADSKKENHCDSAKGHQILKYIVNPAIGRRKDFKDVFLYDVNYDKRKRIGEVLVFSKDDNANREINTILNLNEQTLRFKRFSKIDSIIRMIEIKKEKPEHIRQIIELYSQPNDDDKFYEFAGFIVSWLQKRYRKELQTL